MVLGPHQPFGNATRSIEHAVEVICDMLEHCKDHDYSYMEHTEQAAEACTELVVDCSKGAWINEVDSWMTDVNKNVKGKTSDLLRDILGVPSSTASDVAVESSLGTKVSCLSEAVVRVQRHVLSVVGSEYL